MDLRDVVHHWRAHPTEFVHNVLGARHTWHKQHEIFEACAKYPRVAVAACHESSKTWSASALAWWWAMASGPGEPSCKVIGIAPGGRQAMKVIGGEIRGRWADMARTMEAKGLDLGIPPPSTQGWAMDRVAFPNWWMEWFSTSPDTANDHATRVTGYHATHLMGIFEEAAGIERVIWDSFEGNVTSGHTCWLAIGNPTDPSGAFADVYRSPYWHSIRIDALEHPNVVEGRQVLPFGVTKDWVDRKRVEWGEDSPLFQSKVRGLFPQTADDTLISINQCQQARERDQEEPARHGEETYPAIGVDVARFGSDRTVIFVRVQGLIVDVASWVGQNTMETAGAVIRIARKHGLNESRAHRIAIDDTGVGGGVTDRLREQGWGVLAENFGTKPLTDGDVYRNRRIELWWSLRDWVRDEAALATLDEQVWTPLMADLIAPKYSQMSDGRIELERKDQIKKRIGRSPDWGDALALTLAYRTRRPPVPAMPIYVAGDTRRPSRAGSKFGSRRARDLFR